jgi:integrase
VIEPAGARRSTLHGLRLTQGSLLIPEGVPIEVVSELLGHSNEAFTVSVYRHALPGMQKAAADRFAAILAGA